MIIFSTFAPQFVAKAMKIFTRVNELREELDKREQAGIGFVPTMGALHAGHRSLVERARKENSTVVVSVFVNPTQFNDKNDLHRYPRTPEADARVLEQAGADFVLMPSVEEIYPEPDTRTFEFGAVDKVMEGATRPGHFNGVAQVVSRLFDIVRPARAYFGEKDFQQIAVVKAMVHQLGLPVQIVECPIVRGEDGLALSSRNMAPQARNASRPKGAGGVFAWGKAKRLPPRLSGKEALLRAAVTTTRGRRRRSARRPRPRRR